VRTKGSYFGAQYRRIARRRGPNKAAVAVAQLEELGYAVTVEAPPAISA
jgi:hypothetical protein